MSKQSTTEQPSRDPFNYPNQWHYELFDCCADKAICVPGFICFPLAMCKLHQHVGECFCTPCLCPAAPYMLRTKLRTHYKIEGNIWKDVASFALCPPCTLIQLVREVHAQGDGPKS